MSGWPCALLLENGHLFEGRGFGAKLSQGGEVVFNTGMAGYQEIFTDPSYHKQIVVMSYPHIGNTGINEEDLESRSLFLSGIVVREYCPSPSNWRSKKSLHDYLFEANIPAISHVDTRQITRIIRKEGAQRGVFFPMDGLSPKALINRGEELLAKVAPMEGQELVSSVSCEEPYDFEPPTKQDPKPAGTAVVYDFGVKWNILRHLRTNGFKVKVVPHSFPHQEALNLKPDVVMLSNGPGDPALVGNAVKEVQKLVGQVPIMAVCMGHQVLARAVGASTYKLKFGHHGINHPVKDLITGKILITSQNHGFAVKADDLKEKDINLSHVSLNDQTVEGFHSTKMKFLSVQFHPEAAPGPSDASYLFEEFLREFVR